MDAEEIQNLPGIMSLQSRGLDIYIEPAVQSHSEESGQKYIALLLARETQHQEWSVELHVSPDAEADKLEHAAHDYLGPLLNRLLTQGVEPDGWQHRSDGGYQKWLRLHYFGDALDT